MSIKKGLWPRKSEDTSNTETETALSDHKPRRWVSQISKHNKRNASKDLSREEVELHQSMEADRKAEEELKKRESQRDAVEKAALKSVANRPRLSLDSKVAPGNSDTSSFFASHRTSLEPRSNNVAGTGNRRGSLNRNGSLSRNGSLTLRKSLANREIETKPESALISVIRDKPKDVSKPILVDASTSPMDTMIKSLPLPSETTSVVETFVVPNEAEAEQVLGSFDESDSIQPLILHTDTSEAKSSFDEAEFEKTASIRLARIQSIDSSLDSGLGDSAGELSENESVEWDQAPQPLKTLEILDQIDEESEASDDNVVVSDDEPTQARPINEYPLLKASDPDATEMECSSEDDRASTISGNAGAVRGILKRTTAYPTSQELYFESDTHSMKSTSSSRGRSKLDLASIPPPPPGLPPTATKGILKNIGSFETERLRRIAAGTLRELKRQPTIGDLQLRLSSEDESRNSDLDVDLPKTPKSAPPTIMTIPLPKVSKTPASSPVNHALAMAASGSITNTSNGKSDVNNRQVAVVGNVPLLVHQTSDDDLPPTRASSLSNARASIQRAQALVPLVIITKPVAPPLGLASPVEKVSVASTPSIATPTSASLKSPYSPKGGHLSTVHQATTINAYEVTIPTSRISIESATPPPPPPPGDPKVAKELLKLWMDAMGIRVTTDIMAVLSKGIPVPSMKSTAGSPIRTIEEDTVRNSCSSDVAVSVISTSSNASKRKSKKPASLKNIDTKLATKTVANPGKISNSSPSTQVVVKTNSVSNSGITKTKRPASVGSLESSSLQHPTMSPNNNHHNKAMSAGVMSQNPISVELLDLYLAAKNIKRTPSIEALLGETRSIKDESESIRSSRSRSKSRSDKDRARRARSRDSVGSVATTASTATTTTEAATVTNATTIGDSKPPATPRKEGGILKKSSAYESALSSPNTPPPVPAKDSYYTLPVVISKKRSRFSLRRYIR